MALRLAAISFLNPAPLMWDLEHAPRSAELSARYALKYMRPSQCAEEVLSGRSGLGLVPIASLTPELAVVPGCTIASLYEVRSILLLVKNSGHLPQNETLAHVRTVAADSASRSSTAYARILFAHFCNAHPSFIEHAANPLGMLAEADAALLIGDPALLAREHRAEIDAALDTPLLWLDLATLWREHTGLPWVAAVWAVRPEVLVKAQLSAEQLTADLIGSRDNGLAHIDDLVHEWAPRLPVPTATIREYLTRNIHYVLDEDCIEAIKLFRGLAADLGAGALPPLRDLNMLL